MRTNGEPYETNTRRVRHLYRVTVAQAAERLGITQDAVRQRIRRDTIRHDKDENGRVYVYLDSTNTDHDTVRDTVQDGSVHPTQAHLEALEDQIAMLRAELEDRKEESRRKDHLLAAALERIPAIESPETPQTPETPREEPGGVEDRETPEAPERRSWWRKLFGFGG